MRRTPDKFRYDSPIGPLAVEVAADGAITGISFGARGAPAIPAAHPVARSLRRYFEGSGGLEGVRVRLDVTPFHEAVLRATRSIPRGEVRTYAWVASRIGKPRAVRAVGSALGRNPIPVVIPCHRVVAASGAGGYSGGLRRKQLLLRLEGSKKGR